MRITKIEQRVIDYLDQGIATMKGAPGLLDAAAYTTCGWTKTDRDGDAYPCGKPAVRQLVNATEMWGGPDGCSLCAYHAPRALKRVLEEIKAGPDAINYY